MGEGVGGKVGGYGQHPQAMSDDLVEQGGERLVIHQLVGLGVLLGSQMPQVEVHLVDGHLGHLSDEGPSQGVDEGVVSVTNLQLGSIGLQQKDLQFHLDPPPSAAALLLATIMGDGGDIVDA